MCQNTQPGGLAVQGNALVAGQASCYWICIPITPGHLVILLELAPASCTTTHDNLQYAKAHMQEHVMGHKEAAQI